MGKIRDIAVIAAMIVLMGILGYTYIQYRKTVKELKTIKEEFTIAVKSTVELDSIKIDLAKLYAELNLSTKLRQSYEKKLTELREKYKDDSVIPKIKPVKLDTSDLIKDLEKHRLYRFLIDTSHEGN